MRDLEFLPAWYPQLRRRRRLLALQVWVTLVVSGGLGGWLLLATRNAASAEHTLEVLSGSLQHTQGQLKQLDELLALEGQQRRQIQVLERLGAHVEAARLVKRLEELMPHEMALMGLSFQVVEEQVRPAGSNLAAAAAAGKRAAVQADRRARVKLVGVAPTDVDLANFLSRLGAVPYFEQVAMAYARDRAEAGHVMREFEVSFCVPLGRLDAR